MKQWLPFIIWVSLVFAVSSIPRLSDQPFSLPRSADKVAHFAEYAILAFLFYRGEGGGKWRMGVPAWLLVIAVALAIGGVDEYHQRYIPGRDSDIHDWTADAAGVITGTLIGVWRFWAIARRAEKT
ncbi:MAG TPA: VanZ family protein [Candidatus Bathyarchaeia archaeon]|nr:VanZ family protein [Candidatus Bathyarchaeia archaeon]